MAYVSPVGIRHEATYLRRVPFIHQLVSHPADQAWQSLRYLPSAASALITSRLRLPGRITSPKPIAFYFSADGTAVNPNRLGYLSLADASLNISKIWYRWAWISYRYPMLCFTLVGKVERVPALALLPLLSDPKCCGYSMNPGCEGRYETLCHALILM